MQNQLPLSNVHGTPVEATPRGSAKTPSLARIHCRAGARRAWLLALPLCLVLALFSCSLAFGQGQITGSVGGSVTDVQSAAIPGATLTLTAPDRGFSHTAHSNAAGEYDFYQVPVGLYSLQVTSPGFATFTTTGIHVDANIMTHVNAALQVGSVSAQVTVQAGGSTIDTSSATIGVLIDNRLVQDLPIDGGNVVALAGLLPGVVNVNAPTTFTGERSGPTFNASGSRSTDNLMLLDGSMWNNLFYNTGLNFPPRQGLQEVSVLLNNYEAQYGRNAGSIMNVITASGTNQYHGMLWEYFRNRAMNAADGVSGFNPPLVSNQFGATIGGPIVKNKLYFFANFQNTRIAETDTGVADVPSYAERGLLGPDKPLPCTSNGAFPGQDCASFASALPGNETLSHFLKNPLYSSTTTGPIAASAFNAAYQVAGGQGVSPCYTEMESALLTYGEYLPNAEVPSICFNPVVQNVWNKYVPLPALTATAESNPVYTFAPYPRSEYDGLFRVDFTHGRHNIDARYYISDSGDLAGKGVSGSTGEGLANYEIMAQSGLNDFANIGDTWNLTPSLLNVFRIGYKRYVNTLIPTDPTTINQLGGQVQSFGQATLPEFNFNTFVAGSTSEGYQDIVNEDIEADENLSWTHGNQTIQVGGNYLRLQYANTAQYPGDMLFSTAWTGNPFADSLLGLVYTLNVANTEYQDGIEHEVFSYVQDDWRIKPRLTLNLGLRYELPYVWFQPKGESSTFIPGYQSKVFPNAPAGEAFVGDKGIPRALVNTDYDGIAPRVGFAWSLNGSGATVMRGGFGLFFDAINANVIGVGEPYYDRFNYDEPSGGASEPLLGLNPVPLNYDPKNPQFVAPFSMYFPDKNFKTPYVIDVNYGFQQALGRNASLEVDYVLKEGRHLTMPYDQNPSIYDCSGAYYKINPSLYCTDATDTPSSYEQRSRYVGFNYGGQGLVDFASIATSNYNALQVMFHARASKSITAMATYTYARSMDMDTNGENDNNEIPDVFNLKSEYGPSDFNVKHNFSAGWVYFLPNLTRGSRLLRQAVDNWQFNGTAQIRTGLPYNLTLNNDPSLSDEPNQRPQILPGTSPYLSNPTRAEYFNTLAFGYPNNGTFSTLSRNKFVGPGMVQLNLTAGRTFPLPWRQGMSLAFRADAFNAFNLVNLANPNTQFNCSSSKAMTPCLDPTAGTYFGVIQSSYGMNSALTSNGRELQLSLTLSY